MRKSAVLLLSCLLLSGPAWTAGAMKPGLWEMRTKSDALKGMPKMSPEQVEQMRRMGIEVPLMQDGAMTSRVCVTREMAESELPGMEESEAGCETKNMRRSGNAYSADIVCSGPDMKGTGKVSGTFSGNESFSSTYDFKGTVGGKPVSQRYESSGKWLAADCGNVKPVAGMPRGK